MVVDQEDPGAAHADASASLAARQAQLHLGPLARCRRTVAVPPSRVSRPTRVAQPPPVGGHRLRVEPGAAVADEHRHRRSAHLAVERDAAGAGVLGRVDQRLLGAPPERGHRLVDRRSPTTTGSTVTAWSASTSATSRATSPAQVPPRRDRRLVQPGPQLPLLAAGEPADHRRVLGVPLDQREGLQHRVVQVGGDRGPFLRADRRRPLGGPLVEQPAPQRRGGQRDPDQDDDGRGEAVAGVGQLTGGDQQQDDATDAECDATGQAPPGVPVGEVGLAVELPPDHRQAGAGQQQGDDDVRAAEAGQPGHRTDRHRGQQREAQQLPATGPLRHESGLDLPGVPVGRGHRHGQPEQPVGHHADAGDRQADEDDPDDDRVQPQVGRRPAGDAGQQPAVARAHQRRPGTAVGHPGGAPGRRHGADGHGTMVSSRRPVAHR